MEVGDRKRARERGGERERDRQTERQTERDKETERQRQKERVCMMMMMTTTTTTTTTKMMPHLPQTFPSDTGLSLLILPFCLVSVSRGQWVLGDAWCRGASYLLVVLLVTLHFSLVAISLDRTFAIVSSLRYPYVFTHTRGSVVVAGKDWARGYHHCCCYQKDYRRHR